MIIIVIISFALDFSVGEVTLRTYLELLFYYLAICSHINWYFWFLLTFIIGNVNSSVGFFFAWVNCFCMSWQTCIREQNRPGICQQAHRWTKSIAMRFEHFCAVSNKCLSGAAGELAWGEQHLREGKRVTLQSVNFPRMLVRTSVCRKIVQQVWSPWESQGLEGCSPGAPVGMDGRYSTAFCPSRISGILMLPV